MRHSEKERRERAQCGRLEEGSAADRLSEHGSNTLHVACERPNFAVLSVLLSMDDERIKRRAMGHVDGARNLPIHVAVEKAAGIATIKLLVIEWKQVFENVDCLRRGGINNMTPLHLGCYPRINEEAFTYLVEECRGAIWKTDVHGDPGTFRSM